jgi:uncharacterized protein (TIGR02757 family)
VLDSLYGTYGREALGTDPIRLVTQYRSAEDREVAAWIVSAFAYGRVDLILAHAGQILDRLGPSPAERLRRLDDGLLASFAAFRHRFHGGKDLAAFLWAIAAVLREHGTAGRFFRGLVDSGDRDVGPLIERAAIRLENIDYRSVLGRRSLPPESAVRFLFPRPSGGSACKRWNLYLRWMVRKDDVDFGDFDFLSPRALVMPTDTHVHRVALRLGLTRRKTADWKTAREITDSLAAFDPEDPVKYDFALCRLGILEICRTDPQRSLCPSCVARPACPVGKKISGSRNRAAMDLDSRTTIGVL